MATRLEPHPILAPVPAAARFLTLGLRPGAKPTSAIDRLRSVELRARTVIGFGAPLVALLGGAVEGLRAFPATSGAGVTVPSTQGALWLWLGGEGSGDPLLEARKLVALLADTFCVDEEVAAFVHAGGRDLSGYEDGTENPKGERAEQVAIAQGKPGIAGGSFVAAQRWVHDLSVLEQLTDAARDDVVGRSLTTNDELANAPASAHVKRTAQESFEPEAFMLRRSMPWGNTDEHGLYFVAFGASLDPFERVLRRMVGLEDGITDCLFTFTRPLSGGYYFCPPVENGRLDLRAVAP